jgi:hypothetical protein
VAYYRAGALDVLMAEVNKLWPHRDKTSDGWIGDTSHQARPSDHNPDWSAGGIVRAQDIDEDLVKNLTATGEAMPLVNAIIRDVRTRYVIYEGRIWTRENGWQPYSGVNAHRHHIHVSVRKVNGYDRDRSPWNLAARMSNTVTGGGSVTNPNVPGGIPAAPAKDWFSMATKAELVEAVKAAFDSADFRNEVYAATWANPRWTVPGTDRKENPGEFLSATRVASVQGVRAAGKVIGLSDADIDRLVAALPKPEPVDPADVAAQLTIGVKGN